MRRETQALLIAGDEDRFVGLASLWASHLVHKAGFDKRRIETVCPSNNKMVLEIVDGFFHEANTKKLKQTGLLMYIGHGLQGSFCPHTQQEPVSYKHLAKTLANKGKIIFINDSCYSGSCIPAFEDYSIVPDSGLVITSADNNELSYSASSFQYHLLQAFEQREPFQVGEVAVRETYSGARIGTQHPQRCGISLDHLLFAQ